MKNLFFLLFLLSGCVIPGKSQSYYIVYPANYPTYWQVEEMNNNLNTISNELHDANQARESKEYWDNINAQAAQISQQNQLQENIRRFQIKQQLHENWEVKIKILYDSLKMTDGKDPLGILSTLKFKLPITKEDFQYNMKNILYRYDIYLLEKYKYKTFEEFEKVYKELDYNNLPF